MLIDRQNLRALSADERLRLMEELWDSFTEEQDVPPMQDWQRDELERRLQALDAGTSVGSSWDDVKRRITRSS